MEAVLGLSPLTRRKIAGLVLGFGGVGFLVAPAIGRADLSLPFFLAVGAMQLSAICWNSGTLISRRHRTDPIAAAVVQMLAGGVAVSLVALAAGERLTLSMFSTRSSIAVLYLAVLGSVVAYTAYNYAQTKLSAGKVSSYAYVNPAIAVLTGALLLREPVTPRMIVSMVIILAGVALIQIDRRRKRYVATPKRRDASSVAASAGKNASTRSSWSVMSCGVPRLVSMEKYRRWRSPLEKSMDRKGAVETSRSRVRQRGGTPG